MGRTLMEIYGKWTAFFVNLRKPRRKLLLLSRILGKEGVDARTSGRFYLEAVQKNLLLGLEAWVTTSRMENKMGGFHQRVVIHIMRQLSC